LASKDRFGIDGQVCTPRVFGSSVDLGSVDLAGDSLAALALDKEGCLSKVPSDQSRISAKAGGTLSWDGVPSANVTDFRRVCFVAC
jgi:hypothetical protein